MDVIEPQELFCASKSPVGCPKSVGVPNESPVLAVQRPEFQWAPLVKAQDGRAYWRLMVEFENAVVFSRTPDLETVSRSSFFAMRGLHASTAAGSTHC
jgi:hypothetical protein